MKKIIQVYKGDRQWGSDGPPGFGDFVRGAGHLYELVGSLDDVRLMIDVVQSEYKNVIAQDPLMFNAGSAEQITNATTYYRDHNALLQKLQEFLQSNEAELYISTNYGAWNRPALPEFVRGYLQKMYCFVPEIEKTSADLVGEENYAVLSLRCGDNFFSNQMGGASINPAGKVIELIEQHILPHATYPIFVMSDFYELKCYLSKRYGFRVAPTRSQHGAFGGASAVATDLCILKRSQFNYHINVWANWWSGFSHYTSIIFNIPSMNFRVNQFVKEEISAAGILTVG